MRLDTDALCPWRTSARLCPIMRGQQPAESLLDGSPNDLILHLRPIGDGNIQGKQALERALPLVLGGLQDRRVEAIRTILGSQIEVNLDAPVRGKELDVRRERQVAGRD